MHISAVFLTLWYCTVSCLAGFQHPFEEDGNIAVRHQGLDAIESGQISALATTHETAIDPFSQSMPTQKLDWKSVCARYNGVGADDFYCEHFYKKAECNGGGSKTRAVKVFCTARCTKAKFGRISSHSKKVTFPSVCPEKTFCEPLYLMHKGPGGPGEEVGCTDEEDIKTDIYVAGTSKQGGKEDIYCGLELRLPGDNSHAVANQQPIDIILTEHVLRPDGSPLNVPKLYIRDTTNPKYQFDRVLRQDASVVSALIELGVYRGGVQQRTYDFCMQMVPKAVASTAVFVYSYIQVPHTRSFGEVDRA